MMDSLFNSYLSHLYPDLSSPTSFALLPLCTSASTSPLSPSPAAAPTAQPSSSSYEHHTSTLLHHKLIVTYPGWYTGLEVDNKVVFTTSPKWWTVTELGQEYLIKVFEPATKDKYKHGTIYTFRYNVMLTLYSAARHPRLLIMDGHGFYVTWQFIQFCLQHNNICFCLPAHSTYKLQPLNVGLFSPLSRAYTELLMSGRMVEKQ